MEKDAALTELQARLRHAEHTATLTQAQAMQEKAELSAALSRRQAELERAQEDAKAAHALHRDWPAQLAHLKDSLADLLPSEALYLEYKGIAPAKQSIREWVGCRVYDLVRVERGHREAAMSEAATMREQLVRAESEMERLRLEKEALHRRLRARESDLTEELRVADAARKRYAEENAQLKISADVLQLKGAQYDAVHARAEAAEAEARALSQQALLTSSTLKALVDDKEHVVLKARDDEKKVELLTMDKAYLSSALDANAERVKQRDKELERASAQLEDARRHKEQLIEQLTKTREEHKAAYEDRLSQEIARLQDRTAGELEQIRVRQKEAYERDIAALREARDHAALELAQLKSVHAEAARGLEEARLEHSRLQMEVERERADYRATLKVKAFEYERLGLTLEETMTELRRIKAELEAELKKNRITRHEYSALQQQSAKDKADLDTQVTALQERLSTYAQLEHELDLAIVGAGREKDGGEAGDGVRMGSVRGIHRILESVSDNLPLSSKRRLQQSILLAQQLVEKQRALSDAQLSLKERGEQVEVLSARLTVATAQLDAVTQPQGYLISALRQKDEALLEQRDRIRALEGQLAAAEAGRAEAVKVQRQMEADVRTLTSQRESLTQLRAALLDAKHRTVSSARDADGVAKAKAKATTADRSGMSYSASDGEDGSAPRSHQTTLFTSPAPSSVDLSFASPVAPLSKGKREPPSDRQIGDALPPMWFRKLQQR